MNSLNKILLLFCVLFVTINVVTVCYTNMQVKKIKAENQTLQDAIKNPAAENRGKIVYRTVTLRQNTTSYVNLTENEKQAIAARYEQAIADKDELVESLYGTLVQMQELSVDLGSTSKPNVPVITQTPQIGVKNWFGLVEAKPQDNALNLGVGRKIYRDISVGASLNNQSKYGIILLTRW